MVLKPSFLICCRSRRHVSFFDAGSDSSIGARALPPPYHTPIGKSPGRAGGRGVCWGPGGRAKKQPPARNKASGGRAIVFCRPPCTARLEGHGKRWPAPRRAMVFQESITGRRSRCFASSALQSK